ncbi:phosphate uptake regulator PhoU [Candidatus Woesearchaeota archaeon]|nr:phosphate uptake regulator PhoU [Candidatus Woesearchaeota archaeon]
MVKIRRKVIQIANSTQLISLPRKWAQKYGIKKGDELEVEENGYKLIIQTESAPINKEIIVDVSGLTSRLADRFMARSYQKGYDSITIKYDKPEIAIAIQNKVKELLGFELMEYNKDTLVVKSISSKLNIDFDSSLRRAFLIVIDMADTCLNAFLKNDKKTLENLYHKDFDVNKFCYFCLRQINKGFYEQFGNYILYYLVEILEDGGDEYKALAQHLAKIKTKNKNLIRLLSEVNELTRLGYHFFYKPEKEIAVKAITIYNEVRSDIKEALSTTNVNEAAALNSLDIISRIFYHFPTMRLDTLKGLSG